MLIPVSEEFLKSCIPDKENILSFDHFLHTNELPLIYHENFYVLAPDPKSPDSGTTYALIRDELFRSNLSGLTNGIFRNLNCLFALSSNSKFLILHKLRYNEQIELPELTDLPKMEVNYEKREPISRHIHSRVIGFNEHLYKDEISEQIRARIRHNKELTC